MVIGERLGPGSDAIMGESGKKPIPVLEGVRLGDPACGTQVLVSLVPLQTDQPPVPAVPQEPK